MKATGFLAPLLAATLASVGLAAAKPPGIAARDTEQSPSRTDRHRTTIVVDSHELPRALSPALQGVNVNTFFANANGLWDPAADTPNADATAKAAKAGVGLMRFPGGSPANLYDWKRSIGPSAQRVCQTDGVSLGARPEKDYGPDEFMEIVRGVGAEPEVVVPFPNASPVDVANWFEYMNAPVGTNPNGGIAWADLRDRNGSTEPYRVTRWEIGNEPYLSPQAFWMDSQDSANRLGQFIEGAEVSFEDQPLGRFCEFDPPPPTTRNPDQTYYFMYRLIKEGTSLVVKVGGVPWTEVDDFSTSGATDRVYVLDRETGAVTFGDGTSGATPPRGRSVTASYTFEHEGFVAVHDALKSTAAQIGLDISVCAGWAPMSPRGTALEALGAPSFAQEMKRRGLGGRYDCVAAHPYTSLGTDFWAWKAPKDAHHAHMVGDEWANTMVSALDADLRANSDNDAFVSITELGALWFGTGPEREESVSVMPQFSATMTHATYMASQWMRYAPMDIGWIIGNDLAAPGLRGALGGVGTGFVFGAEAMTREALKPFFAKGGNFVGSRIVNQEALTAPDGQTWPVLIVGAARGADGALHIVAVNRHPNSAKSARVVPSGFPHETMVEVATVQGASFTSFNDDGTRGGDNTVNLTRTTTETPGQGAFEYVFPPASVTVLTLRPH